MLGGFFGLSRDPFASAAENEDVFVGRSLRQAQQRLLELLAEGRTPVLLIGGRGTGKSLLLRRLARQLRERGAVDRVVLLSGSPAQRAGDLVRQIADRLAAADGPVRPRLWLGEDLGSLLARATAAQKRIQLLLDDAHLLRPAALQEMLRLLDGLHESRFALLAASEASAAGSVQRTLGAPAERVRLGPLQPDEIMPYVAERLRAAGGRSDLFDGAALGAAAKLSAGRPDRLGAICSKALYAALLDRRRTVEARDVEHAARLMAVALPHPPDATPAARPAAEPAPTQGAFSRRYTAAMLALLRWQHRLLERRAERRCRQALARAGRRRLQRLAPAAGAAIGLAALTVLAGWVLYRLDAERLARPITEAPAASPAAAPAAAPMPSIVRIGIGAGSDEAAAAAQLAAAPPPEEERGPPASAAPAGAAERLEAAAAPASAASGGAIAVAALPLPPLPPRATPSEEPPGQEDAAGPRSILRHGPGAAIPPHKPAGPATDGTLAAVPGPPAAAPAGTGSAAAERTTLASWLQGSPQRRRGSDWRAASASEGDDAAMLRQAGSGSALLGGLRSNYR